MALSNINNKRHRRVPETFYSDLNIPHPPIKIQQKIVDDCKAINAEAFNAEKIISENRNSIKVIFNQLRKGVMKPLEKIAHKVNGNIDPKTSSGVAFYIGLENIESNTGRLVGETNTPYQDIKSAKLSFKVNDVLYGKLRPKLNKVYLSKKDGICSTDILAFRFPDEMQSIFYSMYFRSEDFNTEVLKGVSGQQLPRTSWGHMQNILVPFPSVKELLHSATQFKLFEKNIAEAQAVIDDIAARKQAILNKYL